MGRREFLKFAGTVALGSAVGTAVTRLFYPTSPTSSPILEQLEAEDREWYEKHQRAANLLFATYEKYFNVDTDRDFYNYARGLIGTGQFNSYNEDVYGNVFPWVGRNPSETSGLPYQIGLAINYPEEQKIGANLLVYAQSDQNVTTVYRPFIALYIGRDLKVLKNEDHYKNMQPFSEEDFASIWSRIFNNPPSAYDTRELKYTSGNLEAVSEHNPRNGELVTYSIFSNGMVRVIVE